MMWILPPCQRAFEIDNTNAMVVNHMSDMQFHKWNVVLAPGAAASGRVTVRTEMNSVFLEPRCVCACVPVWVCGRVKSAS